MEMDNKAKELLEQKKANEHGGQCLDCLSG